MNARLRFGLLLIALIIGGLYGYRQYSTPNAPKPSPATAAINTNEAKTAGRSVTPVPPPAAPGPSAPQSPARAAAARADALAKTAAFDNWLTTWRRADAGALPALATAGRELAATRRSALKYLIETDPRLALDVAIPVGLRAELPAEVRAQLEQRIDARGDFEVQISCSENETRTDRFVVIGGERYAAYVFGRRDQQTTKLGLPLHGIAVDGALALSDLPYRLIDDTEKVSRGLTPDVIAVMVGTELVTLPSPAELEKLLQRLLEAESRPGPQVRDPAAGGSTTTPATPETAAVISPPSWINGSKRVLWVKVDFADDPGAVATDAEIAVTNTAVTDFYAANAQGNTSMSFNILPAVLRLPKDKSVYNASSSTSATLSTDARTIAQAYDAANGNTGAFDPDRYDRWIVVFKKVPAYTFGGQAQLGGAQVRLNGTISPGTTAHELGHTQSLNHSHYWMPAGATAVGAGTHVEYGDVFDIMGSSSSSPNNHFSAPQKAKLGYLDATAITTVTEAGTYRIARHDHRDASGVRSLKIAPANLDYEYWIEHRRFGPTAFNGAQLDRLSNGALLHWGVGRAPAFTSGPGSYLVDATPGSAGAANDAPLRLGESFIDPDAGVTIKPLATGGTTPAEYLDVQIAFGATDGNHNPTLQAELPAGPLNVRSNIIFTATGSDPDGDNVYFRWDFGDRQINPPLNNITRRFVKGGTYSLRVSAHDGKGGIAAKTLTFNVADPLVTWTQRSTGTPASGFTLYGVVFASGNFVAAGDGSTVISSPDGLTWTRMTVPAGYSFRGIAHNGVRFVAAGIGTTASPRGVAAYSDDGVTWAAATMPAGVGQIAAIAYAAGRFVAVGETGRIYTSTDGVAFTDAASPVTAYLRGVGYADGNFVAIGDSGRLLTSPDGVTWTNRSVVTGNTLASLTRHNGAWYALSATSECFTSADAMTWTRTATSGRINSTLHLYSTGGMLFGTTASGGIDFAEDPSSWVEHQVDATANQNFWSAAEGNGLLVIVGTRGYIYSTTPPAASSTPAIAAPRLRNPADSLKVSVGRQNVLSASGSGFTRLELYANGTKVSELNGTAGALNWTPASIGSYSLVVRGINAAGESVMSPPVPAVAGMPDWNWRNPSPLGADLNGAVKVGDKWWVVGRAGAFVTVDANGTITSVDFPTTQHLTAIAYANGRFIVVGPYLDAGSKQGIGSIWTSTDGYSWTALLTTVFDNFNLYGVTYAAGKWVVVGTGGMLQTSIDGLVWTRQVSGTTSTLLGITYANNTWIAVGSGGRIITSPDAVSWTTATSGATNDLWSVTCNNGAFVAVGVSGTIVRSTDGVTWTRSTSPTTSSLFNVNSWNGDFVAVGNSGNVLSSNDGSTWNSNSLDGKFSDIFFVGSSGTSGLLTGRGGEIYVSSNGVAGLHRATQGTAESRQAVVYAGGRFVSVGLTTDPITRSTLTPAQFSPDGVSWTRAVGNTSFTQSNVSLTAIAYGQQTYVTVSSGGRIYTSADANTWTQRTSPATALQALAAGSSGFVAAGSTGIVLSSPDGTAWTTRSSGTTTPLRAAAYGNGRYVIAGDNGTVLTSTDGSAWTAANSGVTNSLLAIGYWDAYGFIAVGNTGTMISSTDGVTWQQGETGVSDNLAAIALTPIGLVAAGGTNGSLIVSLDGASWSIATLPSGTTIRGLAASSSAIVAVGDSGNTLTFEINDSTPPPVISAQPASVSSVAGGAVTFSVDARNAVGAVFQWSKDGVPIPGANTPVYSIPVASSGHAGNYTVAITTPTGTITSTSANLSFAAVANPGRLVNLSILTSLISSNDNFTVGVVVGGAGTIGTKSLLVRAAGPSLTTVGVPVASVLQDPRLEFYTGSTKVGENDNWDGAETVRVMTAQVAAFPYAGATSRDAAIALPSLASGANSARISGTGSGLVIAELYDATPAASFTAATPRLVNVSVLKHIGTGLTAGFVIGGSSSRKVLIRAVGPTLGAAPFGVPGVVADPQLALFSGQNQIAANDNWGGTSALSTAFAQVGAFPLPNTSRDAALLAELQPGAYTVQVSGVGGTTGVALIEVYEVP